MPEWPQPVMITRPRPRTRAPRGLGRRGSGDRAASFRRGGPGGPGSPARVVPVAVAQHDDVDVTRAELESAMLSTRPCGVTPASNRILVVRSDFVIVTRHEKPCSARSRSPVRSPSRKRAGTLGRPRAPGSSLGGTLVCEQQVGHVVDQRRDAQRVDRLERNRFHRLLHDIYGRHPLTTPTRVASAPNVRRAFLPSRGPTVRSLARML
jgi:hypothetical protein